MNEKMPPIPQNLQRSPSSPVPIKRKTVELPTSIDDGGGHVILEGLSLAELAEYQEKWKNRLAAVPRTELELKAINAAIRAKAK
jgi:hypothetical protein